MAVLFNSFGFHPFSVWSATKQHCRDLLMKNYLKHLRKSDLYASANSEAVLLVAIANSFSSSSFKQKSTYHHLLVNNSLIAPASNAVV